MVELLRTTVATVSRGSLGYEQQIDASTERLTHAARLDDLTELKCAIQEEVESIRRITTERRDREAGAFKRLTDRVAVLEAQLTEDQGAIDPLTGIPNRGAFERTLRQHLRDAQAGQSFWRWWISMTSSDSMTRTASWWATASCAASRST
jgi:PleD family two-component response regulator